MENKEYSKILKKYKKLNFNFNLDQGAHFFIVNKERKLENLLTKCI